MLHALLEYAASHGIAAEPGFKPKAVRWLLNFSREGKFLGVFDTTGGDKKSKGRIFHKCPDLTQPEIASAGEGCRPFLVDTLEVVASFTKQEIPAELEKLRAKHTYFLGLLKSAGENVKELDYLVAIASALGNDATVNSLCQELTVKKAKPKENATICVLDGGLTAIVETDIWHSWWQSIRCALATRKAARKAPSKNQQKQNKPSRQMLCIVTGELITPCATHNNKVEGLSDVGGTKVGGGDALVSFDKDAFCSYGLEQGANAAMGESIVKTYVTTINELIKKNSRKLAGTKVVYWYAPDLPTECDVIGEALGFDFGDAEVQAAPVAPLNSRKMENAKAEGRARQLLAAIHSGQRPELHDYQYHAVTIAGNSGRVVVRDWMEGQFTDLVRSISEWFEDLRIVAVSGNREAKQPGLESLVTSLLPERKGTQKYADWIRPIQPYRQQLWQCAMQGRHRELPDWVAQRVFNEFVRSVVNGEVAAALDPKGERRGLRLSRVYCRIGLLKLFLLRRKESRDMLSKFDPDFDNPSYQFGRLVAVMADLQRLALRKESGQSVKAGIVDRFFASACTTPKLVHARLKSLSNHHLRKLGQSNEVAANAIRNRMADISNRIAPDALKDAMTLEDQSAFSLGYYHQIAEMNRARHEAHLRRKERAKTKKS